MLYSLHSCEKFKPKTQEYTETKLHQNGKVVPLYSCNKFSMSLFTVLFIALLKMKKVIKGDFNSSLHLLKWFFLLIDSHNIQDAIKGGK